MASFRCCDNSDVIGTLIMTNFHLNTNACLWRRSLYSNLVLTLKANCMKPPSYASTAYVVVIRPSFLSDSFVKIWATCEIFLGKWFTAPLWQKISRTPMILSTLWWNKLGSRREITRRDFSRRFFREGQDVMTSNVACHAMLWTENSNEHPKTRDQQKHDIEIPQNRLVWSGSRHVIV